MNFSLYLGVLYFCRTVFFLLGQDYFVVEPFLLPIRTRFFNKIITKSRSVGKVAAALPDLDCIFSQEIQNKAEYAALLAFNLLVWSKRPNVW